MSKMPVILQVSKCHLYLDTEFIRNIFYELEIGNITNIYTQIITNKERTSKGNRLHDTKKTYYKNVYITINDSTKKLDKLFSKDDKHLIVNYSSEDFWDVYKCDKIPTFKPKIYPSSK